MFEDNINKYKFFLIDINNIKTNILMIYNLF